MKEELAALKRNKGVIENLLSGLTKEQYTWREREEKWNLLEVICHLYDEEREDFRARIESVLSNPEKPFEKIDPVSWVSSRKYGDQDFEKMISKFLSERDQSLTWLSNLQNPKWDNFYRHPKVGPVSARFLLVNWVAHDYLHIRQITRVQYNYLQYYSGQGLDYAGEW